MKSKNSRERSNLSVGVLVAHEHGVIRGIKGSDH